MSQFKSEEEYIRIKRKTIMMVFLITSIIAVMNLYNNISSMEEEFENRVEEKIKKSKLFFENSLENMTSVYNARTNAIIMNDKILEYIKNKDRKSLYSTISHQYKVLKDENPYLTTMHIVDTNNTSILRLHTPDIYGDDISTKRPIVCNTNKQIEHLSGFEVCKNGFLYRVTNPIFYKNEYIGLIEFGISPMHLVKQVERLIDIKTTVLVPTRLIENINLYKNRNQTIDKYTIINSTSIFQKAIQKYPNLLKNNNYKIELDDRVYFINHNDFNFESYNNTKITKVVVLDDITNEVYMYEDKIINIIIFTLLNIIVTLLILHFSYNYIIRKLNDVNSEIEFSRKYLKRLFDTQPNMIIVSDGIEIIDANREFLEFVGYKTLDKYKRDFRCKCEIFEETPKDGFLFKSQINQNWIEKILKSTRNFHKASIIKNDKEYIYNIYVSHININNTIRNIITFIDITNMENFNETLQQEIKENQTKLKKAYEKIVKQSQLNSMTEMLSMVAHQWRQPLSTITTVVGNLKLKLMMDNIDKDTLESSLNDITKESQKLSSTIDSFREFFKPINEEKREVSLYTILHSAIEKVEERVNNLDIKLVTNIEDTNIRVYQSETIQVIINLLNNAIEAIEENKIENSFIKIITKIEKNSMIMDNKVSIEISDNGGGISDNILPHIYDPYFSTKKKNESGLGLYMSKIIIENHLDGKLQISNNTNGGTTVAITIE
jgi:signal transduction histidine kinase